MEAIKNLHPRWRGEKKRPYYWELSFPEERQISFAEALDFLGRQGGTVLCVGEEDFALRAEAGELAELIRREWYEDDIFWEQGCCAEDHILPDDLYVFDGEET